MNLLAVLARIAEYTVRSPMPTALFASLHPIDRTTVAALRNQR